MSFHKRKKVNLRIPVRSLTLKINGYCIAVYTFPLCFQIVNFIIALKVMKLTIGLKTISPFHFRCLKKCMMNVYYKYEYDKMVWY